MTYLLAEAFRQLQSERFTTIRAIATPDQAGSVAIFQRLGFRSVEPGLIFERRWT
jgi:L-amino acid N-acyltransferase YncA